MWCIFGFYRKFELPALASLWYPDISGAPSFYGACATSYNYKNSVVRIETCDAANVEPDIKKTWNIVMISKNRFVIQSAEKDKLCWSIDADDKLVKLKVCEGLDESGVLTARRNMTRLMALKKQLFYFK